MLSREELGERISERRRCKGLTQEALADRAGVSPETIGRLEQAAGSPSLETVYLVAEALGTTGSALIAEHLSDEVSALFQGLPDREQQTVCVMLRALLTHVNTP